MAIKLIAVTLTLFLVACANTTAQVSTNEAQKITEPVPEPSSWQFPSVIESARKLTPQNLEGKPLSMITLMEPPMFGLMDPLPGCDLAPQTG